MIATLPPEAWQALNTFGLVLLGLLSVYRLKRDGKDNAEMKQQNVTIQKATEENAKKIDVVSETLNGPHAAALQLNVDLAQKLLDANPTSENFTVAADTKAALRANTSRNDAAKAAKSATQ